MAEVSYQVRKDLDEAECKEALLASAQDMMDAVITSLVLQDGDGDKAGIKALVLARVGAMDVDVVVQFRNGGQDTHVALKVDPENV